MRFHALHCIALHSILVYGIDKSLCPTVVLGGDEFSHCPNRAGGLAHLQMAGLLPIPRFKTYA